MYLYHLNLFRISIFEFRILHFMFKNLPKEFLSQTIPLALRSRIKLFPNISRFIPESVLISGKAFPAIKITLICIISSYLIFAAYNQSQILQNNREYLKTISLERAGLEKEIVYWKKIASKYSSYSDVYLKIASLEYRLGNTQTAKEYINKALSLNPDLQQGRVLGEQISR